MAVVDTGADGSVRGTNLFALHTGFAWLGLLAPMPVFFAAAGWANADTVHGILRPGTRSLIGLAAVVTAVWSAAAVAEIVVTGHGGPVGGGARIATQPLWFLAAYVPFSAASAALTRMSRGPVPALALCVVVVACGDIARFVLGAPRWTGHPGFFAAWSIPWLLGAWWRTLCRTGHFDEQRTGLVLAAGGALAAFGLVTFAGYSPSLIDAVPGRRSNSTPPGLFTVAASLVQTGLLMSCAACLDRFAVRCRNILDRFGAVSVAVYAWHLTALALVAGAASLGPGMPERFTALWWLLRAPWYGAIIAVTAALCMATSSVQRRERRPRAVPTGTGPAQVSGIALATVGAGMIGLYGPRSIPLAVTETALMVAAWWLTGHRDARRGPRTHLRQWRW